MFSVCIFFLNGVYDIEYVLFLLLVIKVFVCVLDGLFIVVINSFFFDIKCKLIFLVLILIINFVFKCIIIYYFNL